MNILLVRIMVRSVAEAYPTTGTCRFRNSSRASAIAAMNSNAAESPATGQLNGRGEPTRPPRVIPLISRGIRALSVDIRSRQVVTCYDIVFS